MGLFGKSFDEKVHDAVHHLEARTVGVKKLRATVAGKVVTLTGEVASEEVRRKVLGELGAMVKADQTVDRIQVVVATKEGQTVVAGAREATSPHAAFRHPAAGQPMTASSGPGADASTVAMPAYPATGIPGAAQAPATAPVKEAIVHVVVAGETLGSIAKKYYGNANKATRIQEANHDLAHDANRVRVGQRLRIPS